MLDFANLDFHLYHQMPGATFVPLGRMTKPLHPQTFQIFYYQMA
jgi:hypothetical protein